MEHVKHVSRYIRVQAVLILLCLGYPMPSAGQDWLAAIEPIAQGYLSSTVPAYAPNNPVNLMAYQAAGQIANNYLRPVQPAPPVVPKTSLSPSSKPVNETDVMGYRERAPIDDTASTPAKTSKSGPPTITLPTPAPKKVSGTPQGALGQGDISTGLVGTPALSPFQQRFLTNQEAALQLQTAGVGLQTAQLITQKSQLTAQKDQIDEAKTLNTLTQANVWLNGAAVAAAWTNVALNKIPIGVIFSTMSAKIGSMMNGKTSPPKSEPLPTLPGP